MDSSRFAFHIILLVAICAAIYFPYLGELPLYDKGEPREALAVQDILQRGEWLFPLKRATAIPSKPPLFHWSAALTSKITGKLNEATVRFPSALYATLGVLLLYWFGRRLFGAPTGLLGAAILATTYTYKIQALNARVDMTLCFFLTLDLVLFYSLYRGFLSRPLWTFAFYLILGVGTLAKGPLGLLLPGLVIGSFLAAKKRPDLLFKFSFHPGVLLTMVPALGWYLLAAVRGGEGFVDRQLFQENLSRFFGGSGHSHPVYYYLPYLFLYGLPWSLFLPFLLWDLWKDRSRLKDEQIFLLLWFLVPLIFFSLSAGKRPVYILPLYPALSLLMALWFYSPENSTARGRVFYCSTASVAALTGAVLLIISLGGLWQHDPYWYLWPIESLLKAKDRASFIVATEQVEALGWWFTLVLLIAAGLWFSLAHCLWTRRRRAAAVWLVLFVILMGFVTQRIVMPAIAEAKSYRAFLFEVNQLIKNGDQIFLYGDGINADQVVFYRGVPMETLNESLYPLAGISGGGDVYVIMPEKTWLALQEQNKKFSLPVLSSKGKGPEGDARLVLVRVERP